jgi:hypothetical protein
MDDLNQYYFKFKDLVVLHKKFGFGENPHISPVFSERLVRQVYSYSKWKNRDFDATTENGKGVEIKCTGTRSGTTTVNIQKLCSDELSHVVWCYIDFENDKAIFRRIEKSEFSEFIKKNSDSNERVNVSLSKFCDSSQAEEHYFKSNEEIDDETNGLSYSDYFKSKEAFLIFVLLHVDGEKRAEFLGIKEEMYESKTKAKEWRNSLITLLHSDRCKHLSADGATAKINEIYSRMKKHAE